jgi:hypothetical protein
MVRALASQNEAGRPATPEQYAALGRELAVEGDLRLEHDQLQGRIEGSERALRRAERNARELQQATNSAMGEAEALERARSPRLRAVAVARFIWSLLQVRQGLWDGFVRNLYLGMRVVGALAWMLPKADQARWKDESFSELEDLKQEGAPLLGNAFRIAARTPWLALVLWAGAWRRSPAARSLPRLKPVWIGVGTAMATFWAGAAGIGQHPTEWQTRKLMAASLLIGLVALTGSYTGRRPRRRMRRRRKR